jgi:hypothetical protein
MAVVLEATLLKILGRVAIYLYRPCYRVAQHPQALVPVVIIAERLGHLNRNLRPALPKG